jgi:hypothetical protein
MIAVLVILAFVYLFIGVTASFMMDSEELFDDMTEDDGLFADLMDWVLDHAPWILYVLVTLLWPLVAFVYAILYWLGWF